MNLKRLIFLIILCFGLQTQAQQSYNSDENNDYRLATKSNLTNNQNEKFESLYTSADNYFQVEDYYNALPLFKKLDSLSPNNPNINFYIGVCYLNTPSEKEKALPHLLKATKNVAVNYESTYTSTFAPVHAYFYLAKIQHILYMLDDAIINFEKFNSFLNPEFDQIKINEVSRQIEMCYNAEKIMSNPVVIQVDNLGDKVNTINPEYSPIITQNELALYFTTRRKENTGGKKDDKGQYFEDIYVSYKNGNGQWLTAEKIPGGINTNGHEATISISQDGKEILIYRDDKGDGNIYSSKFNNGAWSTPKKLGSTINTKYWETHACLSSDGNTLFFTSNKPGGFGGRDIYKATRKSNGDWGIAQNLGKEINTEYDEESPFMSSDDATLYFCSKGHECMGGFDIFSTTFSEDGFWSKPENMGYPINTTSDDVFYVPTKDEKHAYYSSVKNNGFGDQDIYLLTIISAKKQLIAMRGILMDDITYKPLSGKLEIIEQETNKTVAKINTNSTNGEYAVSLAENKEYKVKITSNQYNDTSEMVVMPSIKTTLEYEKDFFIHKNDLTTEPFSEKDLEIGRSITLKNILYDFDKATLRPESVNELNRLINLMNKFPSLKIEISSHTDSRGSDEYNEVLSAARAKSVVDFLLANGIEQNRLTFKGYGEKMPVATNNTDEGRQKNRRTDFKIISK